MSNLSELLPTGGGQNVVDFVATGNLANGQTVALKTDGTVEVISATGGAASPVVFDASNISNSNTATVYDSSNNKIVIAYRDGGNGGYGTSIVGTVSGTNISFGTAVVFISGGLLFVAGTFDSTSNKVVLAYRAANGNGNGIVGTVSGTSISWGSATNFVSNADKLAITYDSSQNKIVMAYVDGSNSNRGAVEIGTVSGTSISWQGSYVYNNAVTGGANSITFDSNSNKVVIAYKNGGNSDYGTARVGTVSGTSISYGSPVVFESAEVPIVSATFDSNSNKVVLAYKDAGNSNYGTAIVGTVSGTGISFGSAVVFDSVASSGISATFDSSRNKITIAYPYVYASGNFIDGTVSGTSISFTSPSVVFQSGGEVYNLSSAFDASSAKTVVSYIDAPSSERGASAIYAPLVTNSSSFIGITSEAISNGATGAINVFGGINTVQTGLTIASDYYVQNDGTLSTASASPAIKVGQALSATTINMKDLT